jgi:hypothetical protein
VTAGIYHGAEQRLIEVNFRAGGNRPRLLICHIMQGSLDGTDAWFRNGRSEVSAHFGVGRSGDVYQWVNTGSQAWHAVEANDYSVGVEHEGFAGTPLTAEQVKATAGIFRWAREEYPAIGGWLNKRPFVGTGLSWHGLGGERWGDHPGCPSPVIVAQLGAILAEAGCA